MAELRVLGIGRVPGLQVRRGIVRSEQDERVQVLPDLDPHGFGGAREGLAGDDRVAVSAGAVVAQDHVVQIAAAAVVGTLSEMKRLPIVQMAEAVEERIRRHSSRSTPESFVTTTFGAMCIIDVREAALAQQIAEHCYQHGVLISQIGSFLRLLPPVTIEPPELEQALDILDAAIRDGVGGRASSNGSKQ